MLQVATSYTDQWCDICNRLIPKGIQHWAGSKITMAGIVPLVEYVREHKDCQKYATFPTKDRVVPCES